MISCFPQSWGFRSLPKQKASGGVWKGTADAQTFEWEITGIRAQIGGVTINLVCGPLPSYSHQERIGPWERSGDREGANRTIPNPSPSFLSLLFMEGGCGKTEGGTNILEAGNRT